MNNFIQRQLRLNPHIIFNRRMDMAEATVVVAEVMAEDIAVVAEDMVTGRLYKIFVLILPFTKGPKTLRACRGIYGHLELSQD